MDMVWMVTADTWTEGYGSTIYLVGIFDDEQKADDAVEATKMRYKIVNKYAVEPNNMYDLTNPCEDYALDEDDAPIPPKNAIYLGGYIE